MNYLLDVFIHWYNTALLSVITETSSLQTRTIKIENLRARFSVYVKACFRAHCVRCNLVHAKIAHVYAYVLRLRHSSVYECTQFTLHNSNIFIKHISSLFTYFYKRLHIFWPICFNNTQIIYTYINNKSKVNSLSACYKKKVASGQKIRR